MTVKDLQNKLEENNIPAKVLHFEKTKYELYEIIYTFDLNYVGRDYSKTNHLIEPELDELVKDIEEAVSFISVSYKKVLSRTQKKYTESEDTEMSICKDCIHYEICDEYVSPCESFPECEGGCRCFKDKGKFVEVRHGEWIKQFSYGLWQYDCPFCNDRFVITEDFEASRLPNYCSKCGAKMDGDRSTKNAT